MKNNYGTKFQNKEEWHSSRSLDLQLRLMKEEFDIVFRDGAATCPSHDDTVPSLKYYVNRSDVVKFRCMAGDFNQDIYGMVQMLKSCDFKESYRIVDEFMRREKGLVN
jgi:hypothetical protein